jgi:DNA-binding HxlR family transcriptional regulator
LAVNGPGSASLVTGDGRYVERLHDLHHMLDSHWFGYILAELQDGPIHYTDLLAAIQVTAKKADRWTGKRRRLDGKVLSEKLRWLEDAELIDRYEEPHVWPRSVCYRLTPAAEALLQAVLPLAEWGEQYTDLIERARRRRKNNQHRQRAFRGKRKRRTKTVARSRKAAGGQGRVQPA